MRVRRLPVVDEYLEGDELVVFAEGRVVALSELATAALLSFGSEWAEDTVVAADLVSRFGEPAEGTDPMVLTQTTLESLATMRIVECDYPSD